MMPYEAFTSQSRLFYCAKLTLNKTYFAVNAYSNHEQFDIGFTNPFLTLHLLDLTPEISELDLSLDLVQSSHLPKMCFGNFTDSKPNSNREELGPGRRSWNEESNVHGKGCTYVCMCLYGGYNYSGLLRQVSSFSNFSISA